MREKEEGEELILSRGAVGIYVAKMRTWSFFVGGLALLLVIVLESRNKVCLITILCETPLTQQLLELWNLHAIVVGHGFAV